MPELGENVETGDVLRVLVQAGETIQREQPILEIETDKATIEVPSTVSGKVSEILVKTGDKVKVGQVILKVDDSADAAAAPAKPTAAPASPGAIEAAPPAEPSEAVGGPAPAGEDARSRRGEVVDISRAMRQAEPPAAPAGPRAVVPAAPSVRRLARELGVDVADVAGSGPGGRISLDDVKAHAKRLLTMRPGPAAPAGVPAERLPDFSKWGTVDTQPMRAVRRTTARRLSHAWTTIPHVTQHEKADLTALDALRVRFASRVEEAGGKLTVTAMLLRFVSAALEVFPQVNASIDVANETIIYKKYVHVGVAVDTDAGLLVPVIRDVNRKGIIELSKELAALSERARARKLSREEMEGACFTITNLGGFGGTSFSPIVNWPEVAILGVSRARMEPVWDGGEFKPRLMLPLSLSYDHRAIDGADAIQFLRWIVEAIEQPMLLAF